MIDEDKLRDDLINIIGPAATIYPVATADLVRAQMADEDELKEMASNYGVDINDYEDNN